MEMGSGHFLKVGMINQHSRNVSCPCGHGDSTTASYSVMDDSKGKATPRASRTCGSTAVELIEEISALEYQIVNLEQYLLSMYRSVFSQCLTDSPPSVQLSKFDSSCCKKLQLKDNEKMTELSKRSANLRSYSANDTFYVNTTDQHPRNGYCGEAIDSENNSYTNSLAHMRAISDITYLLEENSKKEIKTSKCNQTLADHLCASLRENVLETPCKLSEDIIKCISAVYCKLSDAKVSQTASSSPFSSLSSSSTFSQQDRSDIWSPRFSYENVQSPLKERYDPFPAMIEISRISIDKDRFKCAASLLESHRNLIRRLEKVDPSKLGHEEKLAFWINIHNAMVMHKIRNIKDYQQAFIAFGLQNNQIRTTPLILKKSYNVGGRNFNAYEIQSSIFGCSPRPKSSRLSFSSSMKLTSSNNKNPYALERSEPLVHFALSMGAYSDPPVRTYTAKNVNEQLKVAKEEYIQANIFLNRDKITLPKILEFYAKDASLDLQSLIEVVCNSLPRDHRSSLQECLKGKLEKRVQWSSYRSTFRYILHRDLNLNI